MTVKIGNRIVYDQDGEIIVQLGEMEGDVFQRKEIISLHVIDLEYGEVDRSKYIITGVDMGTKKPLLENVPQTKTEDQLRIEQLENELLLASGVI